VITSAEVLRERPVEACVDPAFEELAEKEQQRIYDRAFYAWFERALNEERPGLRRALRAPSGAMPGRAAESKNPPSLGS